MIRYAFASALVFVVAAVACGSSFGSDDPVSPVSSDAGDASTGADGQIPSDERPLDTDAAGLGTCAASEQFDDFEESRPADERGWSKEVNEHQVELSIANSDAGGHAYLVDLTKDRGDQRGYLQFDHEPTPCSDTWSYTLTFKMKTANVMERVAGPRLGGVWPKIDAGADGFRDHVAVGFAFLKNMDVELSLTDDACSQLLVACLLDETLIDGQGTADHPISLAKGLKPGWHDFMLDITTIATPSKAEGYGKIHTKIDKDDKHFILPFPMQKMKLESYIGASLSNANSDTDLEIDDVKVELRPNP